MPEAAGATFPRSAAAPHSFGRSGVQWIEVGTPLGTFQVWTRRAGEGGAVKLLLLHGGPGSSHDYLEIFEPMLVPAGVELIFYDQLGGGNSDRPREPTLWNLERFVDEVEQVRLALGLAAGEFYLVGHSWGGMLALEHALAFPGVAKGLVISNMMASSPAYNDYARTVLEPGMDRHALAAIKQLEAEDRTDDPRYMELLTAHHYVRHFLRMPPDEWPAAVTRTFDKLNHDIYVPMQGPSELGISGTLSCWDRTRDLGRIDVPALVLGARHDTMDPAHLEWMASAMPRGRSFICPRGSHLAMYDDGACYFEALAGFLSDVEAGQL